ncbi:FimV/HubP family polar landmark protein [Thiolapillus sp.]
MSVHALGLGGMTTHSALNEKFKADIELISVKKGQLDTLKASLAPASVFNRMGVERTLFLTRLKFRPMRLKDGRAVIRVTSADPIREPFLDFFIKLDWPNGQAVKEYTALLDPPSLTKRRAAKIAAASAQAEGKPASTSGADKTVVRASSRPRRTAADGEYGPVAANETLWEIADDLRPEGISIHQMMMALYKANPQAFLDNNINLLKKGQILKVPAADEITIGRGEAVAEFQQASATGKAPAETMDETADGAVGMQAEPAEAGMEEEVQLKIAGAVETEADTETGQAVSDLEVEQGSTDLRQQMLILEEQAETARQEAALMRSQVEELRQQLSDTQRLLELKDEELARLQEGMSQVNEMDTAVDETAGAPEMEAGMADASMEDVADATDAMTETMADDAAAVATGETVEAVGEESAMAGQETAGDTIETEPAPETAPAEEQATEAEPAAAEQQEQPQPEPEPVAKKPSPAEPSITEDPIGWAQNNMMIAGGAGGALLLALLALLLGRRKKEEAVPVAATAGGMNDSVDQESILMEEESSLADTVADHMAAGNIGDTSFLSEYSTEEFKGLQEDTAEVDPVSEADVYIAYGRYQQAEEILREAMESGNDSAAVKYKMLEVYYATQKKDQFNALAEEMVNSGQYEEDPKAWEHIQTMGRDLDKANPLFATGVAAAAAGAAAMVDSDSGVGEDSELSLDLSTLAEEVDSALSADSEPLEGFSELDLDFSKLDTDDGSAEADDQAAQAESVLEEVNQDDLALGETELHTELLDISDVGDIEVGTTNLDEALADLSGDLEGVMADSQILDEPLDLEDERFSNLEDGLTPDSQISGLEDDLNVSQSADEDSVIGDEVETKLELARAFMEIGDADGARGILQEVEEDGTPEQKETASELLGQLKD